MTNEVLLRPDGTLVHWRSRANRKSASHATRWPAVLFALGSVCFLVASVAAQWASSPRPAIGVTFFVGSLLYTAASYLGFSEAVNVPRERLRARRLRFRPASWRIDWLAAATQLVGALIFNVSSFLAMQRGLDARRTNLRVWAPDAAGLGLLPRRIGARLRGGVPPPACARRRSLSWWIVALNLAGSIAFGVAAIASLIDPSTQALVSARIARIAAGGVRLMVEKLRSDVTKTRKDGSRGRLRMAYGDSRDPRPAIQWLWKLVDGAKTAGELYGRALMVIAAEQHASRLVVPSSQRMPATRWSSHKDIAAKALRKLAGPHVPAALTKLEQAVKRAPQRVRQGRKRGDQAAARRSPGGRDRARTEPVDDELAENLPDVP